MFSDIKEFLFKQQFDDKYKPILKTLKEFISSQTEYLKITEIPIEIDDILQRQTDPNYMSELGIEYQKNEVRALLFDKEFYNDIKYSIPKSIKHLDIPNAFIDYDIKFLSTFPNLETLTINDYSQLSEEQIIYLSRKTKIKAINCNSTYNYNDYHKKNNFAYCETNQDFLLYDNLIIKSKVNKDTEYMEINLYDINLLEKVLKETNNKIKKITKIKLSDNSTFDIYLAKNNIINELNVETDNLDNINKIFDILTLKGYKIDKINYNLNDKKYYKKDLNCLENLSHNTNLYIKYSQIDCALYSEFVGLQQTVKWTTKIINDTKLSPVEKLMFAFDVMKTFKYNESQKNIMDSREPHRIVETGNIVCVGYSRLLEEIVRNLNIDIKIDDISVDCYDENRNYLGGHARNIVRIDDSKYNIHGVFILDSTWDSVKDKNTPEGYEPLDLYRYFLIPANEYKNIFPHDTIPTAFKLYLNEELKDYEKPYNKDVSLYEYHLKNLFDEKEETIKKYLSTNRPSLEQFREMLYNVRLAQGYSKKQALEEINRVTKLNTDILKNNDMTFFEESKTK